MVIKNNLCMMRDVCLSEPQHQSKTNHGEVTEHAMGFYETN